MLPPYDVFTSDGAQICSTCSAVRPINWATEPGLGWLVTACRQVDGFVGSSRFTLHRIRDWWRHSKLITWSMTSSMVEIESSYRKAKLAFRTYFQFKHESLEFALELIFKWVQIKSKSIEQTLQWILWVVWTLEDFQWCAKILQGTVIGSEIVWQQEKGFKNTRYYLSCSKIFDLLSKLKKKWPSLAMSPDNFVA